MVPLTRSKYSGAAAAGQWLDTDLAGIARPTPHAPSTQPVTTPQNPECTSRPDRRSSAPPTSAIPDAISQRQPNRPAALAANGVTATSTTVIGKNEAPVSTAE